MAASNLSFSCELLLIGSLIGTSHASVTPASLSDPVSVYALIDRVEYLPSENAPKTVKVWGAFCVAEGSRGDYYQAARWGYLGFHLSKGQEEKCVAQWKDLASVAGTAACVGFGSRFRQGNLQVRHARQKNAVTFSYDPGFGVRRIRNTRYAPVMSLMSLPKPLTPADGGRLTAVKSRSKRRQQRVRLIVQNCQDSAADIRYLFQIHRSNGESVASPPIEAGEGKTSWELDLALQPGERVTWNVRVTRKGLTRAPVASSSFLVVALVR